MLAAMAAYAWAEEGGAADACVALALRALEDGDLFAHDNGALLRSRRCLALAIADREEALAAVGRALADAHRHGSLSSVSAVHVWLGATLHLRGELGRGRGAAAPGVSSEFELWG